MFLPLDRDEGAYAYVGWAWLTGKGIPYSSFFDHKTPLAYLLYGLAGTIGNNTFLAVRIFSLIYVLTIIILFYLLISRLHTKIVAVLSTLTLAIYLSSISLEGSNFNTEVVMLLPLLGFIFLIWKQSARQRNRLGLFLTGFLGGIAILAKPSAVVVIVVSALWFLMRVKSPKKLTMMIIGILIPLAISIAYFYSQGQIGALFSSVVTYNRLYISEGLREEYIYKTSGFGGIPGHLIWLIRVPSILIPLLLAAIVGAFFEIRRNKNLALFIGLLIFSSLAAIKMAGAREFPHYYISPVLPLCIGLASFLNHLIKAKRAIWALVLTALMISLVFLSEYHIWRSGPAAIQKSQFNEGGLFGAAPILGKWIRENIGPEEKILVMANEPEIYYYAQRLSPTKYIYIYPLELLEKEKTKWEKCVEGNPPDWLITNKIDPQAANFSQKFLSKNHSYSLYTTFGNYLIYSRVNKKSIGIK